MAEKNKPRRGKQPWSQGSSKTAKPSAPPSTKGSRTARSPATKQGPAHAHTHTHDGEAHDHPHDHGHGHHDHDHDHDHGHHHHGHHDHGHHHRPNHVQVAPLARGAGTGKILFFDAPSGIAGDMTIAALVDLGVPTSVIEDAVAKMPLAGFHLHFGTRERSGVIATAFDVHVEGAQPERTFGEIRRMIERAKLEPAIKTRALTTFQRLAEAEARVHRMPIDDVHFHEVGAVDAIVDVVGSAAALAWLDATVLVSPLPMGHGKVRARHGILPLPPPAVVECLRGFPTYDAGLAFELVTPTGAAIVAAHAAPGGRWPSLIPERTGFGAGAAELADRANLLRVVLGAPVDGARVEGAASTHVVLEANIDDASGEMLAVCIEALLRAGALDAWATPATMKKGRPAYVLAALADHGHARAVTEAMLRESTSIGVRRTEVSRVERPRRIEEVKTPFGPIPVKVSEGPFGPPVRKPELDACVAAARAHGVPARQVIEAAIVASAARSAAAARATRAAERLPSAPLRRPAPRKGRKNR